MKNAAALLASWRIEAFLQGALEFVRGVVLFQVAKGIWLLTLEAAQ